MHTAPEEDAGLISTSSRNSSGIKKFYVYASIKSIKEKICRGVLTWDVRILGNFCPPKCQKSNFCQFSLLLLKIVKKTRLDFKFAKKYRYWSGSLCRFFYYVHFLEAFLIRLHIPLQFLLEVEIKPASSSGAVCMVSGKPTLSIMPWNLNIF